MSLPTRSLGLVAAATALISFAPTLDEPAFGPESGSSLTKTFVYGGDFSLDEFSAIVDGQDIAAMLGSIEATLELENTVTITDTYVTSADGRPTKLVRSFDTMEGVTAVELAMDFGSEDQELESSSELEGTTVVFEWDDDEGAFDVSFEEDEGDDDLLEGLVEDMDLRVFLPAGEVSPDDSWEVDLKLLSDVAFPGGNLKLLPDDVDDEAFGDTDVLGDVFGDDYGDYISDLLEGSCVCTYKGTTDEGLGEILVAIELGSAADLSDMLTEIIETLGETVDGGPSISIELADVNLDFEGEGVLLWNLGESRLASFELTGDVILAVDIGITGDMGGEPQSAELSAEMSGSYTYKVETEE
jgi:hypothetical protein